MNGLLLIHQSVLAGWKQQVFGDDGEVYMGDIPGADVQGISFRIAAWSSSPS